MPSLLTAESPDHLREDFLKLRFGMFIHFNMGTCHEKKWVDPGQDPASFHPAKLDCCQWADAAKSAGMKYAVLTTKHHVNSQQPDMLLTDYDQLRCNFLLNCAPNRDGLMDENVVRRLAGVGKAREANPPSQR